MNGAVVLRPDLTASNGVIHVLDRVLYPTTGGDIVRTLEADPERRFTTLVKALRATKLDKEISDYSSKKVKSVRAGEGRFFFSPTSAKSWHARKGRCCHSIIHTPFLSFLIAFDPGTFQIW